MQKQLGGMQILLISRLSLTTFTAAVVQPHGELLYKLILHHQRIQSCSTLLTEVEFVTESITATVTLIWSFLATLVHVSNLGLRYDMMPSRLSVS